MEGKINKSPKLRFCQFDASWEEMVLSDVVSFSKGSSLSKADLSTEGKPCILYGELYTRYGEVIKKVVSRTNRDDKKLVLGHLNDVIIPSSGETAVDIACAAALQVNEVILGGDLNILRPKKAINGSFLSYELNHSRKKELLRVAQGATVVHLYNGNLKSISVCMTSEEEQQKIASFFSLLAQKIEKQREKIEQIEVLKKGMMQKIFSQEIRFKDEEGGEFSEWEEKKLGSITSVVMGQSPSGENYSTDSTQTVLIQGNADLINGRVVPRIYTSEITKTCGPGDIILSVRAPVGTLAISHIRACIGRGVCAIKSNDFIYHFFVHFNKIGGWSKLSQGSTFESINGNDIKGLLIKVPSAVEKKKIADFLTSIDIKIEKEKQKLTALNDQKKGFLQQMFI